MRLPQRLQAVVLFAAVSMLALALSGLLDWITSVLFLGLEFLAESLRPLLGPKHKKESSRRNRAHSALLASTRERPRRSLPRRTRPKQFRSRFLDDVPSPTAPLPVMSPKLRILVPINGDRPGLIDFALQECLERHAEMILLYLRPIAYTPMGPNALPTLAEDNRAQAIFDRLALEAETAGVPLRVRYEVARDMPGTILNVAHALEANVLIMEATRRNLLWRALLGDQIQSILMHLPQRVSLLLHTP